MARTYLQVRTSHDRALMLGLCRPRRHHNYRSTSSGAQRSFSRNAACVIGIRSLEEGLGGGRVLADLVLGGLVVSQRAEMHQAARVAAPVVLRVGRERQDRARDLLRDALLEQRSYAANASFAPRSISAPRRLARSVVDGLER